MTFRKIKGRWACRERQATPLHMCQMTVQAAGLQVKSLSANTEAKVPEVFSCRVYAMGEASVR